MPYNTHEYETWDDNSDYRDHVPINRHIDRPLTADDFCAIATVGVAAAIIAQPQALGVARTLLRSYRASPLPQADRLATPHDFAWRAVHISAAELRAIALRIHVATLHEDQRIISQIVLNAVVGGTAAQASQPRELARYVPRALPQGFRPYR